MKQVLVLLVTSVACGTLAAALFGGEPYEVFDRGDTGYLVMGGSLIDDQMTLLGEGANRQGDTCIESSGYSLNGDMLPLDATVEKAYLIWMGAVDPAKLGEPTDNMVRLSFSRADGYTEGDDIVAGDTARYLGDTSDPFLFESVRFTADVPTGCSGTEAGAMIPAELAYFTYRVDVTDLFARIQQEGRDAGLSDGTDDGSLLLGNYAVGGLDCTQDDAYRCPTLMVSNWAVLLVYHSPARDLPYENIYLYPGFAFKKDESAEVTLSGLDRPYNNVLRMMMLTAEGDPALMTEENGFESVSVWGKDSNSAVPITDDCDPQDAAFNEVWDSRSSHFEYDTVSGKYCAGYGKEPTFGLDIDHWFLDTANESHLTPLVPEGSTGIDLRFRFATDEILTNLLIISENQYEPCFDINGKDELRNCPCVPEEPLAVFCAGEPQYILLTIENWGDREAESIYVRAAYDPLVFDYIPGTTEIATLFDEKGNGTNWQNIIDGPEGSFPLSEPNLITNLIYSFVKMPEKAVSYLIRFQLLPKEGLPKNRIGEVRTTISDLEHTYEVNQGFPLRLYPGICATTCTEKELQERCGGTAPADPAIYDPAGNDDDMPTDADEHPDEITDPRFFHPMGTQTPGCSLTVI